MSWHSITPSLRLCAKSDTSLPGNSLGRTLTRCNHSKQSCHSSAILSTELNPWGEIEKDELPYQNFTRGRLLTSNITNYILFFSLFWGYKIDEQTTPVKWEEEDNSSLDSRCDDVMWQNNKILICYLYYLTSMAQPSLIHNICVGIRYIVTFYK